MKIYNKVGWLVALLVFLCGMGWALSGDSLYYDKVEIIPGVAPVYELVPLTPMQTFGELLYATALYAIVALIIGAVARMYMTVG